MSTSRVVLRPCATPQPKARASRALRTSRAAAVAVSDDPMERLEAFRAEVKRNLSKAAENIEDPILKQAVQEPVAFFGGMFAGLLRLDASDEPLKEWIDRTAAAAGMTAEEARAAAAATLDRADEGPTEIDIE